GTLPSLLTSALARIGSAASGAEEALEQAELMCGCLVGGAVPGLGESPFVEGPQQGEHGQGLEVEGTGTVDCTGLAPGDENLAHPCADPICTLEQRYVVGV